MFNYTALHEFISEINPNFGIKLEGKTLVFQNSKGAVFSLAVAKCLEFLEHWYRHADEIQGVLAENGREDPFLYKNDAENAYRSVFKNTIFQGESHASIVSAGRSQTRGTVAVLTLLVGFLTENRKCLDTDYLLFDSDNLQKAYENYQLFEADGTNSDMSTFPIDEFAAVCEFCAMYNSTEAISKSDPRALEVRQNLSALKIWMQEKYGNLNGITISSSFSQGAGWFPRVPWICLCPPGHSVNDGIYVAICFGREGNGVVAGVAESKTTKRGLTVVERSDKESAQININGPTANTQYNGVFANPRNFTVDDFDLKGFLKHVESSLNECISFLEISKPSEAVEAVEFLAIPSELNSISITESILSKPFVILTGASGTGKTKLATSLATYLGKPDESNIATVAVGADWTDNRSVLGFVNHLRTVDDNPVYQTTPILDLMLNADDDPDMPHILVLDEMNLSHVERYFADFLSAMERREGSLELHQEGAVRLLRHEGDTLGVPSCLEYPKNLFVIGTVNIDETTYMFSPKVLDRANVIEFSVAEEEIAAFLKDPQPYHEIEPAGSGVAAGFLQLAQQAQRDELDALSDEIIQAVSVDLLEIYRILKVGRFEYAFRTAKEVNTYLRVCRHLSPDKAVWDQQGWQVDLDDQILQKLLPKLHGSMGRVGPLLTELALYCHSGEPVEREEQGQLSQKLVKAAGLDVAEARYPKALSKLQAMIQTLRDEQFVSFIQ